MDIFGNLLIPKFLMPTFWLSFAEEGEGDGDGDKGAAGDVQQRLDDALRKLGEMESGKKTLEDAKADLERQLDEADKELLSDDFLKFKESKGKPKGDASDLDLDLDRASNREIATFIEKKYKGDIDIAVKDIRKELDLSKQQLSLIAAQFDVALTEVRHDGRDGAPSFSKNRKEIFEIAKANPTWDAERCYQHFVLVSEKTAREKAEADRKKAEEDDRAATERVGVSDGTVQGKQLSKEEAAEIAYRKAFGTKE